MYKKIIFPNKVRLLEIPSKDTKAITVLFLFGVGSRFEAKKISGASHFIEHLMFKGTKKRPTTLDISKALDRVGAEFNAMTSKDYTGYYVKINSEKKELAIDILSDILLNSKFDPAEMNRERGVIVEEINMYHDNPLMYIENFLEESIFAGNPLGWDISGPVAVIRKITRRQLLDYRAEHYRPDNLVIAVAGKLSDGLIDLLTKQFIARFPQSERLGLPVYKNFIDKQNDFRIRIKYRDTKQVQLALGFLSYGYNDARTYALHLLTIILGGNMSSRLFISVREKRGLCYFVRCYPNFYYETGNVMIQSGLDITRVEEALVVILRELREVKAAGVSQKELNDAKEFLRGKIVLNLEDSSNLAEFYAKQELMLGKTMTPEQKMKKYDAVTVGEIKEIAKEIFKKQKLNLALIGPFKNKNKFKALIKL